MGTEGTRGAGDPAPAGPVRRETRPGGVVTLTMDSPKNRNALSAAMVSQLTAALVAAGSDPEVRVVVLTGAGPVFCSGADLRERRVQPVPAPGSPTMEDLLATLARCPKPVLARVNGSVRAGGMGLVAACDLALAPRGATFAFSEVRVGVVPAIIAVAALRVMEPRALARYALTGEPFSADHAVAAGLLTAAVDPADLDATLDDWCTALLAGAPGAQGRTKELLAALRGRPWDEAMATASAISASAFASPEAAEGIAAFLARRPPAWLAPSPSSPGAPGQASPGEPGQ